MCFNVPKCKLCADNFGRMLVLDSNSSLRESLPHISHFSYQYEILIWHVKNGRMNSSGSSLISMHDQMDNHLFDQIVPTYGSFRYIQVHLYFLKRTMGILTLVKILPTGVDSKTTLEL